MEDVKPASTSRLTLRQEHAALTRRRILDAARALFYRDGYAATTLRAVAERAGVAIQTVYAVFGSKADLLAELRGLAVDQAEANRSFQAAMQRPTVELRLREFARSIRIRWERAGDIVRIHQDAARADPVARHGADVANSRRQEGLRTLAGSIAAGLLPTLDVPRAAAILDALTMPELYVQLVEVHGWTPDEYETWLAGRLIEAIAEV